jgi:DNA polymerase-1
LTQTGPGDHIFLIDASGLIHRAFHVHPKMVRARDNHPIGAVHGFCGMLWGLLRDEIRPANATHIAAIFDYSGRTFRNDIYPRYKAHRPPVDEALRPQFGLIRDAVSAFNIASVEVQGFEADDVIASYAREAAEVGAKVTIVSVDKDLMQLVSDIDGIGMLRPNTERRSGPPLEGEDETPKYRHVGMAEVIERFGVPPAQVCDVMALMGDPGDGVPGVKGIGIKTATALIQRYGDLDTVLAHAGEIEKPAHRANLIEFADLARKSMQLVTLDQHVPGLLDIDALMTCAFDQTECLEFLNDMELQQVAERVMRG